jgi:predicted amidohydrolase
MRVAAVQLNSTADTDANLAAADRLTRAAAADGARLIVLPEKWTVIGTDEQLRAGAEMLDGPAISWARLPALANRRPAVYRWPDVAAERGTTDAPAHELVGGIGSEA